WHSAAVLEQLALRGGWHSAAVLEQTGGLLTWGNNHFGQLGDGRFTCEETPGGGLQDALVPSPCLLRSDVASTLDPRH
ncbi:hypothetical protein T484DRAFT_1871234, partial [Baffinella frigidus]